MIQSRGPERAPPRAAIAAAIAVAVSMVAPASAFAQPSALDAQRARALFFEARTAMAQQQWAEACPKLEESERLDPGIGTAFNLANCDEHVGKLAAALELFDRVAEDSRRQKLPVHEERARARADALRSRIPVLVIDVPAPARLQGLTVVLDDEVVRPEAWSSTRRVEPGNHVVSAKAPGYVSWETRAALVEGASSTVTIPVLQQVAQVAPPAPELPAAALAVEPASSSPPRPPVRADAGRVQRPLGIVATGAGLATVAVGGVFGVLSLQAHDQGQASCSSVTNACTMQQGVDDRSTAIRLGDISTALVIGGGVLAVVGAIVWWTAPSAPPLTAGVGPNGLGVSGAF
jgi:hypothetical protein